jgi:hypothetical protein
VKQQGLALLLLLPLAACGPTNLPVTYHVLPAGSNAPPAAGRNLALVVGPARFPDVLDRPQIVSEAADGTLTLSETERWASNLEQDVLKVLAEDLATALGSNRVAVWGFSTPAPNPLRLTLDVLRFHGDLGGAVTLKVRWTLRSPASKVIAERISQVTAKVRGSGYDALVAAHGRALEDLGAEIAAAALAWRDGKKS